MEIIKNLENSILRLDELENNKLSFNLNYLLPSLFEDIEISFKNNDTQEIKFYLKELTQIIKQSNVISRTYSNSLYGYILECKTIDEILIMLKTITDRINNKIQS